MWKLRTTLYGVSPGYSLHVAFITVSITRPISACSIPILACEKSILKPSKRMESLWQFPMKMFFKAISLLVHYQVNEYRQYTKDSIRCPWTHCLPDSSNMSRSSLKLLLEILVSMTEWKKGGLIQNVWFACCCRGAHIYRHCGLVSSVVPLLDCSITTTHIHDSKLAIFWPPHHPAWKCCNLCSEPRGTVWNRCSHGLVSLDLSMVSWSMAAICTLGAAQTTTLTSGNLPTFLIILSCNLTRLVIGIHRCRLRSSGIK